jgi:hypothetical protein
MLQRSIPWFENEIRIVFTANREITDVKVCRYAFNLGCMVHGISSTDRVGVANGLARGGDQIIKDYVDDKSIFPSKWYTEYFFAEGYGRLDESQTYLDRNKAMIHWALEREKRFCIALLKIGEDNRGTKYTLRQSQIKDIPSWSVYI